ncbi:hypothetical protein M885DRAFT_449140 [Pelagophyceae sp. CCMP2097]|nr:hypothetical protein M885DRAFT_449140 [Pelagophyceae sp. CCMP2097]
MSLWRDPRGRLRGAADDEEAAYYALEAQRVIETLEGDATSLELELVMSGPYDGCACRLEIQAGAGGDDAQDWTAMLIRMYTRFAERRGFSCAQVDLAEGDYPGTVKAATLEIVGSNAYGLLRSEKGAHRLVRISPFNSAGKRQTSFAAVFPSPIVDQTHPARAKDVDLVAKDLDVQTMRSGGAGGQNVNKVETAVRVRHVPTGLAVKCSIHRTQLENKAAAMDMLRGKLLAAMDEQRAGELDDLRGDRVMADFGGSIRTYFLHPYKMVKDAKSGHETAAALDVLDGDLGPFVDAALRHRAAEAAAAALEEAPLP